ncbi:hypothetical protein NQZ68_015974 [Dissostichus eleginoides]|nr:hypothetical protein NQZ68_015974 [Dissostichus eleginoides]
MPLPQPDVAGILNRNGGWGGESIQVALLEPDLAVHSTVESGTYRESGTYSGVVHLQRSRALTGSRALTVESCTYRESGTYSGVVHLQWSCALTMESCTYRESSTYSGVMHLQWSRALTGSRALTVESLSPAPVLAERSSRLYLQCDGVQIAGWGIIIRAIKERFTGWPVSGVSTVPPLQHCNVLGH